MIRGFHRVQGALIALSTVLVAAPASAQDEGSTRFPRSWTADRREFVVGDILTVFVDERTLAASIADDYARDDRSITGSVDAGSSRERFRLGADTRSDERGRARRDERFQTEISVRVLDIDASGALQVEGRKKLQVDDHEQEVVLRGWVRPHDVSGFNVVDAWRVANLELLYDSNGELVKPKAGIIGRILGIIF